MIDFSKSVIYKLRQVGDNEYRSVLSPMLVSGEQILSSFQTIRDGVVFTNYRIIAINVQGLTGTKKDFTSLPYSKIQAYSVETSGVLDLDCELDLWFSGLGKVRFEFTHSTNVGQICRLISEKVLGIDPTPQPVRQAPAPVPQPPAPAAPPPQRPRVSSAKYCPHCYRMLDGDPVFCPSCGKNLK